MEAKFSQLSSVASGTEHRNRKWPEHDWELPKSLKAFISAARRLEKVEDWMLLTALELTFHK